MSSGAHGRDVITTERLSLRELRPDDASFILALVNDADWLRYIGDRGVHTLDDALAYIVHGPVASYARNGFGLYGVELRGSGETIGMCGLIKRDTLDHVDIGFAFLPQHRGRGYAGEAAAATLAFGHDTLGLDRIVAIVSPGNVPSRRLLELLGMCMERMVQRSDGDEVCLYAEAERLFSYGTLQQHEVQMATFGRALEGTADVMSGYALAPLAIDDADVIALSGKRVHTMACRTGRSTDVITGAVFIVSYEELQRADQYEVPAVKRVTVRLHSGTRAWVYVSATD